jgi:hypothetical protein
MDIPTSCCCSHQSSTEVSTVGIEIRLRSDVPSAASIFAIVFCSVRALWLYRRGALLLDLWLAARAEFS